MKLLTTLIFFLFSVVSVSAGVFGNWRGVLRMPAGNDIRIFFHINAAKDSIGPSVSMDSPDQGAFGLPGVINYLEEDSISFEIPRIFFKYNGRADGDLLKGQFSQGFVNQSLELALCDSCFLRPQTPEEPFPYNVEHLKFENKKEGSLLAGTLTVPNSGNERPPLVVLVSGSGLQNRDEEAFGHKPFAVISDYLARNGIAAFRYDDRGAGESLGELKGVTTDNFASDAREVMSQLRATGRFGSVGIVGHSEGGLIAFMLGAESDGPDFIISIAGNAVRGDSILVSQNRRALSLHGIDDSVTESFCDALGKAFTLKIKYPDKTELSDEELSDIYPQYKESMMTRQLSANIVNIFSDKNNREWMNWFLSHSPADDLKKLKVPAFIIYGKKDRQVPADLNAIPAKRLASNADVKVYKDLNHLMQHASTGDVSEYFEIAETFSPEVLNDMVSFIKNISNCEK